MRNVDYLIIHSADTYADMDISAKDIERWHKARGWRDIGYHYFIKRDGTLEKGRDGNGAHTLGYNDVADGVCYAGGKGKNGEPEFNMTVPQLETLLCLCKDYIEKNPSIKIGGHNYFNKTACPSFDTFAILSKYEHISIVENLMKNKLA